METTKSGHGENGNGNGQGTGRHSRIKRPTHVDAYTLSLERALESVSSALAQAADGDFSGACRRKGRAA